MVIEKSYIHRRILPDVIGHLDHPEITMLVGPRQAGKTTILRRLEADLRSKGEKTLWFNLDIEDDFRHVASQGAFLQKIKLEFGSNRGVVFVDEIQRKENAGVFLKGIFDQDLPIKFVVSGSGSIELKEKISESLAGRKRVFELSTISFEEFVDFRTEYRYSDRLRAFFLAEPAQTDRLFREYLAYGGYPQVVLADTHQEKTAVINEIYQSYLEKDIVYLLKVTKSENFTNLVRLLADQAGKMVNYSELSATLGLSIATVKNYLWYLEKTFILQRVTPWFTNIRKEITKSPIYYFQDIGLRNFASGVFGSLPESEAGVAFQGAVYNMLRGRFPLADTTIHYWRTKDKAEVDFVLRKGEKVIPIEVKYRDMKKTEIRRSFRSFIDKYRPLRGFVVNRGLHQVETVGDTEIYFMPYWELLFEKSVICFSGLDHRFGHPPL